MPSDEGRGPKGEGRPMRAAQRQPNSPLAPRPSPFVIALLPGDGIGPEVLAEARGVLDAVAERFGHSFTYRQGLIGGAAIDATGEPLPAETLELCRGGDAVLLGAVGGPKWDNPAARVRPEQGLLG